MIAELFTNISHSTSQGLVGVTLIIVYFIWIIGMAAKRIKKSEHMDH